ncbi:HAMP domain-containing protein, partial [Paenibacillus polymyxa]|nr:HAMP domain-containing protein [Paenibacillus polymyxa]
LGAALGEYAKASGELYHSAFTQSQNDYRFAKWQMAVLALALVIVLVAVWYGIRHILLNPLGRVIAHIRDIGRGDLTKTLTVSGRNEITELATSVDH